MSTCIIAKRRRARSARLAPESFARPAARAVLEAAAARAGWRNRAPRENAGFGVGFAKYKNTGAYCAVVAEI